MTDLKPFPVDDVTLSLVETALDVTQDFDENGDPIIASGAFDLHRLLNFLSGYDPTKVSDSGSIQEYGGKLYSTKDLIRALIDEIRILRESDV